LKEAMCGYVIATGCNESMFGLICGAVGGRRQRECRYWRKLGRRLEGGVNFGRGIASVRGYPEGCADNTGVAGMEMEMEMEMDGVG
jgi:hypothetical protein